MLRLFGLIFCFTFSQVSAGTNLEMVYIVIGYTHYSPEVIMLGTNGKNETIFGGDISYESLSLNTVDMPKADKLGLYNFGAKLRQEYDSLLGPEYSGDKYVMHSSAFPVSMMSGLLINAGNWPPSNNQKWNQNLNWQPVPYKYETPDLDDLFLGTQCPNFQKEIINNSNKNKTNEKDVIFKEVVKYIESNTELKIYSYSDMIQIFHLFHSMETNQIPLPDWAKTFYSNGTISTLAMEGLNQLSTSPLQKKLNGGTFLKKIISDFDDIATAKVPKKVTMSIFAGDVINLVGLMKALNVSNPTLPMTEIALIFELHFNNDTKVYEVVVKSQTKNLNKAMQVLTVKGCESNCSVNKLREIISNVLPDDESQLCGRIVEETIIEVNHSASIEINVEPNISIRHTSAFWLLMLSVLISIKWFR